MQESAAASAVDATEGVAVHPVVEDGSTTVDPTSSDSAVPSDISGDGTDATSDAASDPGRSSAASPTGVTETRDAPASDEGGSWVSWPILGGVLAAALVAGVALTLLFLRIRRSKRATNQAKTNHGGTFGAESGGENGKVRGPSARQSFGF